MNYPDTLKMYQSEGLSFFPIPLRSKKANDSWKEYQSRRPTPEEFKKWLPKYTNIAIVCGKVSGNLVVVDFDSMDRFKDFAAHTCRNFDITDIKQFTRMVQTSKGMHLYFRTKEPTPCAKFNLIDIKGEGGYVIGSPSIHPTGAKYELLNPQVPIRQLDSLKDVGIDIKQQREVPKTSQGGLASFYRALERVPGTTRQLN
jgi:hypothetical protein